ncbi:beta-ketoacyl-ACP synthase II [Micromonospora aurantiaca]|uniref:3-oxoacyl-[acyl-carrier-protein] synthase 2 n=1 Tax=Micromonospora aurantiaca (nom. illeg.) TaxID=47850 RepID=A0A1C6TLP1_9ACTN|nr:MULTISPECIES: beta-ketoacyl-ACP synthase II [Micromonospora]ADU09096.1 3-oxoacyl-(acyl-carrier-protein) synthase 2 [Micromonospora sp. L5]AXH94263.1 beta-ketoacyl-[acyl-carrier-protein] synthase II [Micromonospora aurantiaca]KAB1108104.1 beta-ketoacyl-ACP synthase II [Micromonospora aurantiaca]MBC9003131.1 beta-ketoacyl-ACP synthase II [Micromonospora aurantiaca]MDG4753511.1 beta-ketoacyl-ACP synthase II [Micromonospora sp. WMMD718]
MSRPDVVVTGLGATTPLGGDVASTWDAMLAGRSGVGALTQEWAAQLPVRIAAELAVDPSEVLDRVKLRRLDRSEAIAIIAAKQAWADAGLDEAGPDPERLAVSVGSGIGGATTLLAQDDILEASGPRRVSPHTIPMLMPNGPAAWVGLELGAKAGVHTVASACATGAEAIALGLDIIRAGRADVVVAGGTEAVIHPLPIAGFSSMRAMSTRNDEPERASRPWDSGRDGFVLGEGAGVVILERADHAAARGARVYARLAGAGITSDAYDIVQPHAEGEGAIRAIARAVADADVARTDIVHVNAHATSTPVGDMLEIGALRQAVGDHPVLTATKSMTGHLLGAAGALESIATILAIRDGVIPPTINLDDPDEGLTLDVAAHKARHMEIPAALNNAFGFGGHNVALVFTRP